MGLTDCYTLEGREIKERSEYGAPCIFCGKHIYPVNDGGIGWILGAVGPDANPHWYLYCDVQCDELNRALELETPNTPEKDRVIFRCGCESDYVESVGHVCHECEMDREHLTPIPEAY